MLSYGGSSVADPRMTFVEIIVMPRNISRHTAVD